MDRGQKIVSYRVLATRFSFKQLNLTFARQLERVIGNETGIDGDLRLHPGLHTRREPAQSSGCIACRQRNPGSVGLDSDGPKEAARFPSDR